jgi:hypothetical protein
VIRCLASALLASAALLGVATGATRADAADGRPLVVAYWNDVAIHAKTELLERQLGFESTVRFALNRFRGFKAVLTDAQVEVLQRDRDVVAVRSDPGMYVFAFGQPVDVDARASRLERLVGFRSELRYTRLLHGFAARLSLHDVLTVAVDPAFDWIRGAPASQQPPFVAPESIRFVVMFGSHIRYPDTIRKNDELQRALGLEFHSRWDHVGGFSAPLSARQLHALTRDSDVAVVEIDSRFCVIPEGCDELVDPQPRPVMPVRVTAGVTRALRAQLLRGEPSLRRERVGAPRRVRVARSFGAVDYAEATFCVGRKARTDRFRRHVAGGWLWVGRTGRQAPFVPADILRAWGARGPAASACARISR